jgi:hypothetical protein
MVNLQLDWEQASVLGLVLLAGQAMASRSLRSSAAAPYLQESAIVAGLYALWQLAASVSLLGTSGAFARGRWIERVQRSAHLPSERSLQHLIADQSLIAQLCNLYYAAMHFGVLGVFLLWLFVRHRDRYAEVRTALVLLTAACLLIQLIPVAPPRLFPDLGFVDVAAKYGQSVYNLSGITVDELGAMPSVHVGWALLVAWAVLRFGTGRHRWWILLHPVVTVFVVAATGNHFWLDGIAAGLLLVPSVMAARLFTGADHRDAGRTGIGHGDERSRDLVKADHPCD